MEDMKNIIKIIDEASEVTSRLADIIKNEQKAFALENQKKRTEAVVAKQTEKNIKEAAKNDIKGKPADICR